MKLIIFCFCWQQKPLSDIANCWTLYGGASGKEQNPSKTSKIKTLHLICLTGFSIRLCWWDNKLYYSEIKNFLYISDVKVCLVAWISMYYRNIFHKIPENFHRDRKRDKIKNEKKVWWLWWFCTIQPTNWTVNWVN